MVEPFAEAKRIAIDQEVLDIAQRQTGAPLGQEADETFDEVHARLAPMQGYAPLEPSAVAVPLPPPEKFS